MSAPRLIRRPVEPALPLAGNVAPIVLAGDLRGRMGKMFGIGHEQRDGQGDDRIVSVRHPIGQAHEAVAGIVDKATDVDVAGAGRRDDDFGHDYSFRAGVGNRTIAEGDAPLQRIPGGAERRQ